jgi:photosystem II stability/assembly factor-like uncharacterized protein
MGNTLSANLGILPTRTMRTLTTGIALVFATAITALAQVDPALFEGLRWREIGPFRGGRSCAVAGTVQRPDHFFMGATGGGVWKTEDAGQTWRNVSDGFFATGSVGSIDVSRTNPDIVYVAMGETQLRGNVSHGDGVYKSMDGGKTWTNVGLQETRHIARVRIHPTNPDIVYVAALGHVYGPNPERGLFKTTDGGRTWQRILYVSDRAGAVDISFEPNNPDVLYAATWEAWRTPYSLNSGGPGSKLFKSTDGGRSWVDISRNPGLPKGVLGKIGVSVSPADPNRVYAIIEAEDGGIFRSDDAGATWQLVNDDRNYRQRAFYYTRIYADPKDRDKVYVLNVGFFRSTDGGRTFRSIRVPHSDNHDLWIHPDDTNRMINANDGGANVTTDGGNTWSHQNYATAQMYHVSTDNAYPYNVLGAQQDNSTVRIPSRTRGPGIRSEDWTSTAGGESGYVVAKPDDPGIVVGGSYGGHLEVMFHRLGISRNINAWPDNPMGHGAIDLKHRFQWTFPILFSSHDPDVLYISSQYLMRSTNLGQSWTVISPDLTRNDPRTLQPSGGPITKDNTSVEYYATIFTIAESPRNANVIWCGSDDGLVHVTRDGGRTWTNVTPREMPEWGLCSIIDASAHAEGTAYLAVDNHENDDFKPYIFKTDDFGRTWTKIVNGLPPDSFVRVVREDPKRRGLLFCGTESHGVFVSFDDGANWQSIKLNLPIVPVHDLVIKDDDLVAATHGRSFWILDDFSPLREVTGVRDTRRPHLFKPADQPLERWGGNGGPTDGANPMSGIVISYYLPNDVSSVRIQVVDQQGNVVGQVRDAPTKAGMHRVAVTNLSYPSFRGFQGMILWAAGPRPVEAPPGEYIVRASVGEERLETRFRLLKDPRTPATEEDLVERFRFTMRLVEKTNQANDAVVLIRDLKTQVQERLSKTDDAAVARAAEAFVKAISAVEEEIYQVRNRSGQDPLNYPIKLNNRIAALIGVVQGSPFRPTDQAVAVFEELSRLLDAELARLSSALSRELAALNNELRRVTLDPVTPRPREESGGS